VKRRNTKIVGLLLPVGAVVAVGLFYLNRPDRKNDNPGQLTAQVVRRSFASSVLATGAIKPQVGAEVRVGARLSGRVERLLANIGDVVKKGQVIAELERKDLEAILAQRKAELKTAEAKLSAVETLSPREIEKAAADVAQWEATVTLTKTELGREDHLFKKGFSPQQDRDRAQERLLVAEAQRVAVGKALELAKTRYAEDLKQAKSEVERVKAALATAQVELSYATITAPISGVIGSVSTQEGETVAAGLSAPTFVTIVDLNRLQVDTFVDEVDIGKIAVGQKVVFTVDSFPSREFAGKAVAIYPKAIIQENVVNYDVIVEITDKYEGLLRPEMTASVTISLEARDNVLAVPAKALRRERGKNVVHIPSNGQVEPREIKVGWRDGQWIEVVSGLEEGQTVLLETQTSKPAQP
jgi:multidrug efflux pump subunit AcrA (membrane-fusion protein)